MPRNSKLYESDEFKALASDVKAITTPTRPQRPMRIPATILGNGYELGFLDPPGVLVMYLPPGVEVVDIEAAQHVIKELTSVINGDDDAG